MHPALQRIREATIGTPFEGQLWLVGGAVRDEWLGRPQPNDFDLVTELSAGGLAQMLFAEGVSDIPPVTYARFGTALARVEGVDVELATARKESYVPESRKPEVEPATLIEDARRRDFTINTLLRNLHSGELYDPLDCAIADLEARVLRTPLDPAGTFRDDPLRMLRAVRFVWNLGFTPAPGLYEAIRRERARLEIISGERIREELVKMLRLPDADKALEDIRTTGLLEVFAPELAAMKGVTQGSFHHLDVWDHTLLVLKNAGRDDLVLTLSALLHDMGKPPTRSIQKGDIRFYQHESVGAEMASKLLDRLRFSGDEIAPVVKLVRNHMRLQTTPKLTAAAARRLMRDLGPDLERLIKLVEADIKGLKPGVKAMDLDAIRERLAEVREATPVETLESPLTGQEIMTLLGISEGPRVGELKSFLLERVLEGELAPGNKMGATRLILGKGDLGEGAVDQILNGISKHKPQRPDCYVVAVSGFCGAGKSTLAREIAGRLPNCAMVEADMFWNSKLDERCDDWKAIDRARIREDVLESRPIRYRPFDWGTGELGAESDLGSPSFLILEGIGIFHPDIDGHFDLKVWVDAPMEEAHAEGMRRDREEYQADHERQWQEIWIQNDRDYFERFRPIETADVVVPWFKG